MEKASGLTQFKYLVFQHEVSDSGTHHYQGYIEFHKVKTYAYLQRNLAVGHYEARQSTAELAKHYCEKPVPGCTCAKCTTEYTGQRVAGPWSVGEWNPTTAGKLPITFHSTLPILFLGQRTDLLEIAEIAKSQGLRAAAEHDPSTFIKYSRGLKEYVSILAPVTRVGDFEVILLVGLPGVGKTYHAIHLQDVGDTYIHPAGSSYFDDYSHQSAILFDEYKGQVPLSLFLQILDEHCIKLNQKFGGSNNTSNKVYITSNFHPYTWYSWIGRTLSYQALCRRITDVIIFEEIRLPVTLSDENRELFFGDPLSGPNHGHEWGSWTVDTLT